MLISLSISLQEFQAELVVLPHKWRKLNSAYPQFQLQFYKLPTEKNDSILLALDFKFSLTPTSTLNWRWRRFQRRNSIKPYWTWAMSVVVNKLSNWLGLKLFTLSPSTCSRSKIKLAPDPNLVNLAPFSVNTSFNKHLIASCHYC